MMRTDVLSVLSGQGAEKAICDSPLLLPALSSEMRSDDTGSCLCPRALSVPGHLHTLFNGLEEAVKHLPQ